MGQIHPVARAPLTVHKRMEQGGTTIETVDLESVDSVEDFTRTAIRESYLANARLAVLRDAVSICYKQYGPNQAVKCRPIYIEYLRHLETLGDMRYNIPELHPELLEAQTTSDVVA